MSDIMDLGTKLCMQENRLIKKKTFQGKVVNSTLLLTIHTCPLISAPTWTITNKLFVDLE